MTALTDLMDKLLTKTDYISVEEVNKDLEKVKKGIIKLENEK